MKILTLSLCAGLVVALCPAVARATDSIPAPDCTGMSLDTKTGDEIKMARLKGSHKILYVGDGPAVRNDSVERMIELFYYDQFRHFQDPLAPYFLLMSKDATLAMGIGGSVRMRAWADFDGSVPANGFIPYLIPVPRNDDMRKRIGGTPGGTAIFLRVIGRNPTWGDIIGYIQCDFSGMDNVTFKLKKAYVTINDWTVGYASTTFSDPAAEAPTIDGAGQNGRTSRSSMLIRWQHGFDKHWSMASSVEMPSNRVDADGVLTRKLDDYLPDVSAFGQYGWGHSEHLRLSGIARFIPYRNLATGRRHTVFGWGAQLSTVINPIPRVALYGEVNTGKGYQSYMGDLSVGAYDIVADGSQPGKMYAPLSVGMNVGAKYNFSTKVYAAVALGKVAYYPDYKVKGSDYRYGLYGALNLFYEPTPRLQAGVEYLLGSRHNFDRSHASANRVDILFQFAF